MRPERQALRAALQAGRTRDAVRRARALARAGEWDLGVAATLIRHAAEDAPERAEAEARLDVALAASALLDRPDDEDRLARLLERLVATGRAGESLCGLRLSTRARRAGVRSWLGFVIALFAAGDFEDAWAAAEEAVALFPGDAQLWAVVAHLRLVVGGVPETVAACRRALELEPRAPLPRLTLALLCALRGDRARLQALLAEAAQVGVPAAVVNGIARKATDIGKDLRSQA